MRPIIIRRRRGATPREKECEHRQLDTTPNASSIRDTNERYSLILKNGSIETLPAYSSMKKPNAVGKTSQ